MTTSLDDTMEKASRALVDMDYLACEALCLAALAEARRKQDWSYYAAILLPLQEARRQRRMIAADGVIRVGTSTLERTAPEALLAHLPAGCVVLTAPFTRDDARVLAALARQKQMHVEVLFAEAGKRWLARSLAGPDASCVLGEPPAAIREAWHAPGQSPQAVQWVLDACEALGDAALAPIDFLAVTPENLARLESCLDVVTDHENIHQRLGDMARRLARRHA